MSAAPVPPRKKKQRWTAADAAREAAAQNRRMYDDQRDQAMEDRYAAQRFSELTDGSSQKITKRGVRQRGMSDAEAGTMIRGEIAAGKAKPAEPADATAFQPTGMGKPIALRTEAERLARISGSPLSTAARPVFSTKGTGTGDFSASQSEAYRKRALAMGASAKMPGSPNAMRETATPPPSWDRGAIRGNAAAARMTSRGQGVDVNSPAGQNLRRGFEPQMQPMGPPRPTTPAGPMPATPPRSMPMREDLTKRAMPAQPMVARR